MRARTQESRSICKICGCRRLGPVRLTRAIYHWLSEQLMEVQVTIMEVANVTFDTDALEECTVDELTQIFNGISGKDPVGRFRDKATGLVAVRDALAKREIAPADDMGDAELPPEKSPEPKTMPHGRE